MTMTPGSAGSTDLGVDAESVFAHIHRARLVPLIRVHDAGTALQLVDRLLAADLDVVEITATIDGWDEVIRTIRRSYPAVCAGAGTVTTAALAQRAVAAGAQFCVSPCLAPQARAVLEPTGVPMLEGGLTPIPLADAAAWLAAEPFAVGIGSELTEPGDTAARVQEALHR